MHIYIIDIIINSMKINKNIDGNTFLLFYYKTKLFYNQTTDPQQTLTYILSI